MKANGRGRYRRGHRWAKQLLAVIRRPITELAEFVRCSDPQRLDGFFAHGASLLSILGTLAVFASGVDAIEHSTRPGPALRPSTPLVEVHDSLVSIEARDASWPHVLEALSRATGMSLALESAPEGAVTVSLRRMPIEAALKRLFGDAADFVFVYDAPGDGNVAIFPSHVRVLRHGESHMTSRETPVSANHPPLASKPGEEDRLEQLRALRDRDTEEALPALVPALRDASGEIRREVAGILGELGHEAAIAPLGELLLRDAELEVRTAAISALAQIGTTEAMLTLSGALFDPEPDVRVQAVEALSNAGLDSAVPLLEEALRDRDEDVRRAAAEAIAGLAGGNATPEVRDSPARRGTRGR